MGERTHMANKEEHISNSDAEDNQPKKWAPESDTDDDEDDEGAVVFASKMKMSGEIDKAFYGALKPHNLHLPPLVDEKDDSSSQQAPALELVTTEGLTPVELDGFHGNNVLKASLRMCNYCNKYYRQDMIVPANPENKDPDETQCWHCLFWMNYAVGVRKSVDGKYGMTIIDYILKCKDIHEMDKCTRNNDSGGCFLCEHNLGLPLTDVKDLHRLRQSGEVPDRPIDEDQIDFDDPYKPGHLTVSI